VRAYFESCLLLGKLLRDARYSTTRIVDAAGTLEVRKQRAPYAPVLMALGEPLVWALDTGVSVLAQADWEHRERLLFETLYGKAIRVDADGTLILPHLPGKTLTTLLDDTSLGVADRSNAIQLAVAALTEFHAKGFTHGDAMAENVLVDIEGQVARWFDFETIHDASRDEIWRRADDVRALLATCLLRTPHAEFAATVDHILDSYGDTAILPHIAASFSSTTQRALIFHLGQAPLSYKSFHEIGRLLNHRLT
jgi:hypothetical protein